MRITLLLGILFVFFGCSEDNTSKKLNISDETAAITYDGSKGIVRVNSNKEWKASSEERWIHVITKEGEASKALHYQVDGNLDTQDREGKITIKSDNGNSELIIRQKGRPKGVNLKYRIPIIFHVLYYDENDKTQNPPYEKIIEKINMANGLMEHAGKNDPNDPNDPESESLGVEFVLATRDPQGNLLKEPGVERIKWHERKINQDKFMYGKDPQNIALLWDPNKYVNVMLYNFTQELVAGVATFPVLPEEFAYKHLSIARVKYVPGEKLKDVRCVSINSQYIIEDDPMVEVGKTLAHELGHYLGLRHVFSEEFGEEKNMIVTCHDTDGCEDTPSYNRKEYGDYSDYIRRRRKADPKFRAEFNIEEMYKRKSCDGKEFISRNIMDYDYCKKNLFTKEQKAIVRRVLENALFMPGPKFIDGKVKTRTFNYTDKDYNSIPFMVSKCPEMIRIDD